MKAIITIGISASGKTTWAEDQGKYGYRVISRDDCRVMLLTQGGVDLSQINMWSKWNFKREKEVTDLFWAIVTTQCNNTRDIILADTNLNPQRRAEMHKRLESLGYEVEYKQFDVSYEEAVKRDKNRKDTVGADVIYKQWLELYGEKYEPDLNLPKAIICDVDGTLAVNNGRSPFDWNRVDEDTVDETIKHIVNGFTQCEIIILSGRDGCCYDKTFEWLEMNSISFSKLLMRSSGDTRKDYIIKRELYDSYIRDSYNVIAVIDDRPQVIREWHRLGLRVISVADQLIEF